jgi:hypothetical protein
MCSFKYVDERLSTDASKKSAPHPHKKLINNIPGIKNDTISTVLPIW